MKIAIRTLGCKLNQFESEAVAESLRKAGHDIVAAMEDSEAVVVNTCTVTNRADYKSRQIMRQAKKLGKFVTAAGCYAATDGDELANCGFVDLVVGNDKKFRIAEFLEGLPIGAGAADDGFPEVAGFERTRAFLKIQDGCDKFCSYCKVPYARGRSVSLEGDRVVSAANRLIDAGFREIVLTGVNTSGYDGTAGGLAGLVGRLLEIPGDYRLRLSSLQPDEFDRGLIPFLAHPNFAAHFHLSLQSGSDAVLKAMNRKYVSGEFLGTVAAIRDAAPDCGITTDIIVGFPTETEKDFKDSVDVVRRAEFTRVHIFAYSPRSGTIAAKMKDLDGGVKKRREAVLKAQSPRPRRVSCAAKLSADRRGSSSKARRKARRRDIPRIT
jgi:threonylcarbamoyladenosine tRNA methylthiotransferase MtaB